MNTKKKLSNHPTLPTLSSKGFTLLEALIIVVIVAVLGLAGWYLWHRTKQDSTQKASDTSQSQSKDNNNSKASDTSKQADPSEGGKYLVIKEWGVRFPLTEGMRGDVRYKIRPATSLDPEIADFEVGRIARMPGSLCTLSTQRDSAGRVGGYGIGVMLSRLTSEPPANEVQAYGSDNFHHFGNYWYRTTFAKASCLTGGDESSFQLEGDARSELGRTIQQLELID